MQLYKQLNNESIDEDYKTQKRLITLINKVQGDQKIFERPTINPIQKNTFLKSFYAFNREIDHIADILINADLEDITNIDESEFDLSELKLKYNLLMANINNIGYNNLDFNDQNFISNMMVKLIPKLDSLKNELGVYSGSLVSIDKTDIIHMINNIENKGFQPVLGQNLLYNSRANLEYRQLSGEDIYKGKDIYKLAREKVKLNKDIEKLGNQIRKEKDEDKKRVLEERDDELRKDLQKLEDEEAREKELLTETKRAQLLKSGKEKVIKKLTQLQKDSLKQKGKQLLETQRKIKAERQKIKEQEELEADFAGQVGDVLPNRPLVKPGIAPLGVQEDIEEAEPAALAQGADLEDDFLLNRVPVYNPQDNKIDIDYADDNITDEDFELIHDISRQQYYDMNLPFGQ